MYQVILNADDLGYSPAVNRAILHAASAGTLTAASLMVNMPFAEEAVKAVRKSVPNLSLGLHFCLTSGRAVAPTEQIPLLVDSDGRFRHGFPGLWRLLCSPQKGEALEQIRIEFFAQRERMDQFASEHDLRFDHLDSHQHVHVFPEVFDILEEEAQKRNFTLRVPREFLGSGKRILRRFFAWFPSGLLKKGILDYHLRKRTQTVGYYGILETGKMDLGAFCWIFETLTSGKVYEINVHPSEGPLPQEFRSEDSSSGDIEFHRSPWRKREYAALLDPALKTMIEQKGIQLVGFSNK
ncbi:MAG: ChbG/HpnK family deacetylase [Planctomycetaceae bacterium]|nr:ChbG/HpnK family deacetylase [Planctomycetaceae bacterium]